MELDKIEKLLEKYFEASTTIAEEELLQEYFAQEEVAVHLQAHAPLFQYVLKAKEEQFTKQLEIPKPESSRSKYYRWSAVAAAAVLMFGIYFGNNLYQERLEEQRQAEYAYNETKKALNLLAENFGRGTEKVAYLKEFERTTQKIYKNNN